MRSKVKKAKPRTGTGAVRGDRSEPSSRKRSVVGGGADASEIPPGRCGRTRTTGSSGGIGAEDGDYRISSTRSGRSE